MTGTDPLRPPSHFGENFVQTLKVTSTWLIPITTALILAVFGYGTVKADTESKPSYTYRRLYFLDQSQQPSDEEFVLAAKRTFYRRNVEFRVINGRTVRGIYKRYEYEIRRLDNGVEIRYVGSVKGGNTMSFITGPLDNLERDLVYELGRYLL